MKILYVQYADPAAYPPLEHSAHILARVGWQVVLLGTKGRHRPSVCFRPYPGIQVKHMSFCPPGLRQKIHYLLYGLWVLAWTLLWRPRWIYCSDAASAPMGLLGWLPGVRVIYHEHDWWNLEGKSAFQGLWRVARQRLLRHAQICVWPNRERAALCAPDRRDVICVWNCPGREEVGSARTLSEPGRLEVLYHGSINPVRLPITVVKALALLPCGVRLSVIGYETAPQYMHTLREAAGRLGVADRLQFHGTLPKREDLLAVGRQHDVGLSMMPTPGGDLNERNMSGASNTAFDYLSQGLALLVSDLPDWKETFVDTGYGLACDPNDPARIAEALRWFLEHPEEMRAMGERGRRRILEDWNYETQFQPVLERLSAQV